MGSYPSVLSCLPEDSVVCVNPPFTDAYLADVMSRLEEFKWRFRLRIAIPIQDMPWRSKLYESLPRAQVLRAYYDASDQNHDHHETFRENETFREEEQVAASLLFPQSAAG